MRYVNADTEEFKFNIMGCWCEAVENIAWDCTALEGMRPSTLSPSLTTIAFSE